MAVGTCLLTGKNGTFVKSHLTPLALTAPEEGIYFIQSGEETRPTRSHTSWYDKSIVTRKGEDILADIDGQAIAILRELRLVWSGWPDGEDFLSAPDFTAMDNSYGARKIQHDGLGMLRIFFLSLLWRWGVSRTRPASEIIVPPHDMPKLRDLILQRASGEPSFYPISLTQLSSRGPRQNLCPLAQNIGSWEGEADGYPIFRFYFDGLIAHIHRSRGFAENAPSLVMCATDALVVPTIAYGVSAQHLNLQAGIRDAQRRHPDSMRKLGGCER